MNCPNDGLQLISKCQDGAEILYCHKCGFEKTLHVADRSRQSILII